MTLATTAFRGANHCTQLGCISALNTYRHRKTCPSYIHTVSTWMAACADVGLEEQLKQK